MGVSMAHIEKLTIKTAEGIEAQIRAEIRWPGPEGRPQGVYMRIFYVDGSGKPIEARPAYYGTVKGKTGLVASHGAYHWIVFEIPKAVFLSFKDRCLKIFRDPPENSGCLPS